MNYRGATKGTDVAYLLSRTEQETTVILVNLLGSRMKIVNS